MAEVVDADARQTCFFRVTIEAPIQVIIPLLK